MNLICDGIWKLLVWHGKALGAWQLWTLSMNSGNSCTNLCARGRTQHCWGTAQSTVMAEPTALCRAGKPPPIPPHPHCVPCSSTAHVDVLHPTVLFQQKVQLHVPSPGCYLPSTSCMPASRCFKYIYIYFFFFPEVSQHGNMGVQDKALLKMVMSLDGFSQLWQGKRHF